MEFLAALKVIWIYMLNVGTNAAFVQFVTGNVLLLGLVAYITPWKWDNKIVNWMKKKVTKGDSDDEEKPT